MPGLFDTHVHLVLQKKWAEMAADVAKFTELFGESGLDPALLTEWHASLAPGGSAKEITFTLAFATEKVKLPCVAVQMIDEPMAEQALNYFHGIDTDTNRAVHGVMLRETVHIYVYAGSPEILRALYVVVRGILLAAFPFLMRAGYTGIEYSGGGDIQPERGLLPEELGVLVRSQRWSAISVAQAAESAPFTHKGAFVAASDVTVDGHNGGVTPKV